MEITSNTIAVLLVPFTRYAFDKHNACAVALVPLFLSCLLIACAVRCVRAAHRCSLEAISERLNRKNVTPSGSPLSGMRQRYVRPPLCATQGRDAAQAFAGRWHTRRRERRTDEAQGVCCGHFA